MDNKDVIDSYMENLVSLKSLVAAAAVVAGIGQAAEAATVKLEFDYAIHGGDYIEDTSFTSYWGLPVGAVSEVHLELDYPASAYAELRTEAGLVIFGDLVDFMNGIFEGATGSSSIDYTSFYWDGASGYVENSGEFISEDTYKSIRATLTAIPDIAPVPLPATAALLPLGIGALAMVRRRRRQIG